METITQRVTTDEPVVLVRVKDYMELLDKVEDNYLEMLYAIFGVMYEYGNTYTHEPSGKTFKEGLDTYIRSHYPFLTLGTKGDIREGTKRLTVKYNHKWRQLEKDGDVDTEHTEEGQGEV